MNIQHFPSDFLFGHNLPSLSQIARSPSYPAYLRIIAMDLSKNRYSTVGSILSEMNPLDVTGVLTSWMGQLEQAIERKGENEDEQGEMLMFKPSPSTSAFLLFTKLVAQSEAGEVRFDPITSGFQAELMSTFLQAIVVARSHDRVDLDLTRFTLGIDFLDQNFDHVISTTNFKAMKYVSALKSVWGKMRKAPALDILRRSKDPIKEVLIQAPAAAKRPVKRVTYRSPNLDIDLSDPSPSPDAPV